MRKRILVFCVFIFCLEVTGQISSINELPSIDGCVFLNLKEKKIAVIDKIYSNILMKEERIIINDSNVSILENFSIYSTEKYEYYLIDYFEADPTQGSFSVNTKTIIVKAAPEFGKLWEFLDFRPIENNKEFKWTCEKSSDKSVYTESLTQVIKLKENKKLLINRKKENINFKLALDCGFYTYKYNLEATSPKIAVVNKGLLFLHINQGLYIIEIGNGLD